MNIEADGRLAHEGMTSALVAVADKAAQTAAVFLDCKKPHSEIVEPAVDSDLDTLWLSYHILPLHLKRCFGYFSIFPKGYEFHESEKEKVILLWMVEGILQPENGKRMEDVGEEYLNALTSRSFFQRSSWNEYSFFMHDLMRDLAMHTLLLSGCKELTQLRIDMSCLISLRHFDISGTCLKEMPLQLSSIKDLQSLSDFVVGENNGSSIKALGALQLLHGSLCISGLENVVDIGDVYKANMKSKKHLTKLILRWDGETDDSLKEREILNALQPHTNLKELDVIGYRGTRFADWLPSLIELEVVELNELVSIGDEFCGTSSIPSFQSLEKLSFSGMFRWENWSITRTDQKEPAFPCLKEIDLQCCWKLKVGLPDACLHSLKKIAFWFCNEMQAVFPISQHIDSAYPSLESLFISCCSRVETFSRMGLPSNLKQLQIQDCKMLFANRINWDLQRLSSLLSLQLTRCEEVVDSFPEKGLLPTALTSLEINNFPNLKGLNGKGFLHLTSLQQLAICSCKELKCLPNEGLPRGLSYLDISKCVLLSHRCQRGAGEDWPKISHIPRIFVDWKRV
ncbi:putative disease resistance RPP13-like protein 1 [Morus notabilis]|uniref:putative disease resistance RPP13-like protein 1 n=1 Tax=Morus notabilis TaxID=981085 RepID=UPI000CED75F4|nr:putative disease resistance RPP13-like protein 1 [Morus notabilis]